MRDLVKTAAARAASAFQTGTAREDAKLIRRIRRERLTYLSELKMKSLASAVRSMEDGGLEGSVVEAGCALGGSTILIGSLKSPTRPFRVYDVFGMIPPPSDEDPAEVHSRYESIVEGNSSGIGSDRYYGYEEDLYSTVQNNLRRFDLDPEQHAISLIKGLLQDTMHVDGPVALAHVDVDWYDPVKTCLERVFPHLVVGGSIILDDYNDWGGCRKATDEYLESVPDQFVLDDSARSMRIVRTAPAPALS
jgi:asparagine synthase (glutamine-hydrolysing)